MKYPTQSSGDNWFNIDADDSSAVCKKHEYSGPLLWWSWSWLWWNDGHDKKLDIENPQIFGQFEFLDACKAMGIMMEDAGDKVDL